MLKICQICFILLILLRNLDLSKFHTNNVINMSLKFSECSSLISLDI